MIYLILFLGLILRLVSINQSLWLDEATTALVSQMSISDFFTKFMTADFHPPLYYLVIHYWTLLFGTSEIALRIPSVIFGVGTIYVVYLIAKDLKFKHSLVAALFLATSGLHVYYSQEARMYAMATFLVASSILYYIRSSYFKLSIILVLIFLTDYLSILIVPVLFVYSIIYAKKDFKKIIYSFVPLGLAFAVWLPTFYKQLINGISVRDNMSNWWGILGTVNFKNIILIPIKFVTGRISIDQNVIYILIISLLLILYFYFLSKAKNKLIWSWLIVSFVAGVFISFFIPTLTYFRYLFILPAFYLLLSESTSKIFIAFVLFINLLFTGLYLFNPEYQRENWRELSRIVGKNAIILPTKSQQEALVYYDLSDNVVLKEDLKLDQNEVWLSRYVWNIFDSSDSTRKYLENLGYNWTEEVNLNGVVFWKYIKL